MGLLNDGLAFGKPAKFNVREGKLVSLRDSDYGIYDIIDLTLNTDSFQAFAVWGDRGAGKSTCALQLGYYVFSKLYPDEKPEEIWKMVLDHVVFSINEFDHIVKKYDQEFSDERYGFKGYYDHTYRIPWIYWDDAGLHGSRYFWYQLDMRNFASFLDVIRVYNKIFMYSAPSVGRVIKSLRDEFLTGEIWIPKKAVKLPDGTLKIIYGQAWFIYYSRVPDFFKPGREFVIKEYIDAYGQPFTFKKLPPEVEKKYNLRKQQAIQDLQTARKNILMRKKKFVKEVEETLMPIERTLLMFMATSYTAGEWVGVSKLAEDFTNFMRGARKFGKIEISTWLRALRSLRLVQSDGYNKWRVTDEGLTVVEVWKSRKEKKGGEVEGEEESEEEYEEYSEEFS